jgi:hypothetical protein
VGGNKGKKKPFQRGRKKKLKKDSMTKVPHQNLDAEMKPVITNYEKLNVSN